MAQISTLPAMDRTTLTANPKRLERQRGYSGADRGPQQAWRVMVLTPAGRSALAAAVPSWTRTHRVIEGGLEGASGDLLWADLVALNWRGRTHRGMRMLLRPQRVPPDCNIIANNSGV